MCRAPRRDHGCICAELIKARGTDRSGRTPAFGVIGEQLGFVEERATIVLLPQGRSTECPLMADAVDSYFHTER
jgi:hypothetical protein